MEVERINNVRNRVFEQNIMLGKYIEHSMSTDSEHTYRITGMNQVKDIILTGYIRPKEIIKGGHKLEIFWTHGGEKLFYYGGEPVLEVLSTSVRDGQIGALSIHDLTGVYIFDYNTNRYVNRLDEVLNLYNNQDLEKVDSIKL